MKGRETLPMVVSVREPVDAKSIFSSSLTNDARLHYLHLRWVLDEVSRANFDDACGRQSLRIALREWRTRLMNAERHLSDRVRNLTDIKDELEQICTRSVIPDVIRRQCSCFRCVDLRKFEEDARSSLPYLSLQIKKLQAIESTFYLRHCMLTLRV